jgi:NADPH2:quinone reductase
VFEQGLDLLAPFGRMVAYGAIGGELPALSSQQLFGGLRYTTAVSMIAWRQARPALAREDITAVTRLWQAGELRPAVHATCPLSATATIHDTLDRRANLGRLVAVP